MGNSCSSVQHKRRVSMDSLFPIANVDLVRASGGNFFEEGGRPMSEEEIGRAVDDFQTLAKQFPEDNRVQLYLGIGLFLTGFREAAINPLRIGIQGNGPQVAKGYYILGTIYMSKNNGTAARAFLEKGLVHQPGDIPLLLRLAELNFLEKRYSTALEQAKAVLHQQPGNVDGLSLAGQSQLGLGAVDQAILNLKAAATGNSKSFKTYFALGNAYRRKEKLSDAILCFKEAIALSQDVRFFLHFFSLATVYLELDMVVEAVDNFKRGMAYGHSALRLMEEKGFDQLFTPPTLADALVSVYAGNLSAGEQALKRISDESGNPLALYYLGIAYLKLDNLQLAKSCFLKSILFLQGPHLKPMQEYYLLKASQGASNLDNPMEENLTLGEIDEEHSRGPIKELYTHSTPLSQNQSPDHSFSLGRDGRHVQAPEFNVVTSTGFQVRAESLDVMHNPRRVKAPSPGSSLDVESRAASPKMNQSSIRKFIPRGEEDPSTCGLF